MKKKHPPLTVARRVQILYNMLMDITGRFIWSEDEAKRQEQVFQREVSRQITNHARDILDDLIEHFNNPEKQLIEVVKILNDVRRHIPCDEPDEEYCLNCDRLLEEHGETLFGDVKIRICYAHPEREMLVVGIETAKVLSERLGLKLDSQNAPDIAGPQPAD